MRLASVLGNPWLVGVGSAVIAGLILLAIERWLKRRDENRKGRRGQADASAEKKDAEAKKDGANGWMLTAATVLPLVFLLAALAVFLIREAAPPVEVEPGEAAMDGPFVFTLTDFECGLGRLAGAFPSRPVGEYCLATLRVINRGNESASPDGRATLHVGDKRFDAWPHGPAFDRESNSPQTNDVTLMGVVWGGDVAGTIFAFSRMNHIQGELGAIDTCVAGFAC